VSGQIGQESAGYLGIINGIVYRIDNRLGTSWGRLEPLPMELQSKALDACLAKALHGRPASAPPPLPVSAHSSSAEADDGRRVAGEEATAEKAPAQKDESIARLFAREGSEPLRAGHPDLWRLLVAGTCLEGGTFRSV
jgi:hypothetical protein